MTSNEIPDYFPSKEFAEVIPHDGFTEYVYEENRIVYGATTSGRQLALPAIYWRALVEIDEGLSGKRYLDGSVSQILESQLTREQRTAIQLAQELYERRQADDPTIGALTTMHEINIDSNDMVYVSTVQEGFQLADTEPYAVAAEAWSLGVVDFATHNRGAFNLFQYDAADIPFFVPPELEGIVNAYKIIDVPRRLAGADGSLDYALAKIMLFQVTTDLNMPIETIQT